MSPSTDPGNQSLRACARRIVDAALAGADAGAAMRTVLPELPSGRYGLISIGKAAVSMAAEVVTPTGLQPAFGVVVTPAGIQKALRLSSDMLVLESDHPYPTKRSVAAGEAVLGTAARCAKERTPLVLLLSGGASSLVTVPEPGLSVEDLAKAGRALMRAGATIDEVNTVRRHCDRVKGGRLAAAAAPAPVHTFIVSDVIGDALETIGSGPAAPDPTTFADALAILSRYKLLRAVGQVASHLRTAIATGATDTHKPGDPVLDRVSHRIILRNQDAVNAAAAAARELGFTVAETRLAVTGEARDAAFDLVTSARRARAAAPGKRLAIIWGGETTVEVHGHGSGGRNLEAAAAAAITLDGDSLVIATLATDGADGHSSAAGAIVDGQTASLARRAGADPEAALAGNDSFTFFERAGGRDLLRPGPTGTNVNDVWIALVG